MLSLSAVPPALLKETRAHVFMQIQQNPDEVDPLDVNVLHNGGNLIERFVVDYLADHVLSDGVGPTSLKISSLVMESLKWRMTFGINHIKDSDLPIEFFNSKLFECSERPDGILLIIMNVGNMKRLKQWSDIWLRFIVHEMEKLAQHLWSDPGFFEKQKIHVLVDSSRIGFCHMDFHFIISVVPIFLKHFPQALEMIWMHGLPLFSHSMLGLVLRALPARVAKKMTFTDSRTIVDDMGIGNVPVRYGGSNGNPTRESHSTTASSLRDVGRKNGISDSEISRMIVEMSP